MRLLRLSPLAVVFLVGGLACMGLPTGSEPSGGVRSGNGSSSSSDPLLNPAGQQVVDTTIPRTSRAYFPLSEDLELLYDEVEFRGAGDRILFKAERPAGSRVRGQWRFAVTGVDRSVEPPVYTATFTRTTPPAQDADAPDDATPITRKLRLWVDGDRVRMEGEGSDGPRDAVEIAPGPPVVASEEVECTLRALGGIRTTCRAVGGLGGDQIGPEQIFLDFKNDWGNALSRTLIGIASLGTVIPESKRRSWRLERTLAAGIRPERQVPAFHQAWTRAQPSGDGLAELKALSASHPPDAASLAAIASSQPAHVEARTVAAMGLLPVHHRAPVIREALRALSGDGPRARILLLGRLDATLGVLPESHRASIESVVGPVLMDSGVRLGTGACPSFARALEEPVSVPWSEAVRVHMAEDLAQPACDQAALGVPQDEAASDEILDLVLEAQPPGRWATRLRAALESTSSEQSRFRLLERYRDRAAALPQADRQALAAAFQSDDREDQARGLLGLPPAPTGE